MLPRCNKCLFNKDSSLCYSHLVRKIVLEENVLGMFKENKDSMANAIKYLEDNK